MVLLGLGNISYSVCMHVQSLQSCLTLCDPMDCSPPGSSVHGILQARILEWVAIPFSRESSPLGIEPMSPVSPALQADSLLLSHQGSSFLSFSSVQFSLSVVSNSLWPHESQHARPPCPSPTSGVHPNSCASSPWCHPAISSSVVPFSSCPQSLQASGSFPLSQLFAWGGHSIGVSASASVLPINNQDWFPLGNQVDLLFLQSKGLSRVFSSTTVQEAF